MKRIHQQFFKTELNFDDAEFFEKIENPTREDNPLQNVVRASGKYRDQTVIDGIKNVWDQGHDIFIVYGEYHARSHEKELRNYQ